MKTFLLAGWGALLLGLSGCSGSDPSCKSAKPVKFSDLQASIFTPSCATAACHRGSRPAQDLSLEQGKAYAALKGKKSTLDPSLFLVKEQDPSNSVLYTQVKSGAMPQDTGPLSADQQLMIHDWICNGAPDLQPGEAYPTSASSSSGSTTGGSSSSSSSSSGSSSTGTSGTGSTGSTGATGSSGTTH